MYTVKAHMAWLITFEEWPCHRKRIIGMTELMKEIQFGSSPCHFATLTLFFFFYVHFIPKFGMLTCEIIMT